MKAVRKNRYVITQQDFDKAYKTVVRRTQKDYNFYKWFVFPKFVLAYFQFWLKVFIGKIHLRKIISTIFLSLSKEDNFV